MRASSAAPRRLAAAAVLLLAPTAAAAACVPGRVDIRWEGGQASFAVEVADDGAERAQGLMFRERLASSAGMLFVYPSPRQASFWMKDTLIPLDMLFADATGRVRRIHAEAQPGDLTTVDGGPEIMFVLEINGGLAARLGIPEGAELRHPALGAGAAWPCP